MRVFVTGATGVVGCRVIPLLLRAGHDVTAVIRSPDKAGATRSTGARAIVADLFDRPALGQAVAEHEAVVNLATHMPPSSFAAFLPGAWSENDNVRRIGAANLVEAALVRDAKIFIQESFAPAYPDRGDEWIDEGVPLEPVRYNRTILDAERAVEQFSQAGRTGIVLRFGAFYGPDAVQVRDLVRSIRRGWAPIPGRPDAFFSSIAHDDAASAVVAALAAGPGAYNVVDDEPLRRREYFDSLAEVLGVPPPKIPPAWMAYLFGSIGRLLARSQRMSNRKLRAATGWAPRYPSVREGWPPTIEALGRQDAAGGASGQTSLAGRSSRR